MVVAVPLENFPAVFEIQLQNTACQQHDKAAEPGGDVIEHIVQLCRNAADVLIGHLHIAQHGIHGVHRLIGKGQGRAPQGKIEHGGDHAVGAVLRHGLHRRPGHGLVIQRLGVPAHNHGDGVAGIFNGAGFQGGIDLHALGFQALGRQDLPAHHGADRQPQPGADQAAEIQQPQRHAEAHCHGEHPQNPPRGHLPCPGFGKQLPQSLFQGRDQLADEHHRMGNAVRVSHQAVQEKAQQEGEKNFVSHMLSFTSRQM